MSPEPPAIRGLFDRIAGRYDLLNSLLSFGLHHHWKRIAAVAAAVPPGALALDVATGTGDIARALAARGAGAVGLDFSRPMLAVARRRTAGANTRFVLGDALRLPFPDDTFAAATIGFTLRNVASRPRLFSEMARVTGPGGRVLALETSQPPHHLVRAAYHAYLRAATAAAPLLSDGPAYRHLADSVIAFPGAEEIAEELRAAGLRNVQFRRLFLGVLAVHIGEVAAR